MTAPVASALPVTHIGPGGVTGAGNAPVPAPGVKPIRGEDLKPAPMLPPEIGMSEVEESRFAAYLDQELWACESERMDFIFHLAELKRKYKAPFPTSPKDFPIANASQITIPVIKTAVNSVAARMFQTVMAAEPLVSVRTEDQDLKDAVYDYEKFLEIYSEQKLDMEELIDPWITEIVMLGTGVLEPTTLLDRRKIVRYDPEIGDYVGQAKDVFAGPIVYHVPLEDFWIRPAHQDPQKAPWCGKVLRLTWGEIKDLALSGEFNAKKIDRLWNQQISTGEVPQTVIAQEKASRLIPQDRDQFQVFELCVRWDVDGDGVDEELVVYYHRQTRTFLRRKHNGFRGGRRPWVRAVFVNIPHWFYGEGLAEMLEHLQEEISTQHNQRIDNATISNLKIILVRHMIAGLRPGDRLWTGKVVKVPQSVKDDVGTLQLGEIYPSTTLNENISQGYVREVSGASEVVTGQAQPVSRTTAAAQLALLEELNRRFDKPMKHIRRALRQAYNYINDLFFQAGTGGLAEEWLGPARGRRVEELLRMPQDYIGRRLKIRITATRASINREVEFQTHVAMLQLIQQMGQQVLTMAQQLAPQAIGVLAHELVRAYSSEFKKIMQYGDATDPDTAISVLAVLERILPSPEDLGGMAGAREDAGLTAIRDRLERELGGGGANPSQPQGNGDLRRLEGLLSGLGGPNGGGGGVPGGGRGGRGL